MPVEWWYHPSYEGQYGFRLKKKERPRNFWKVPASGFCDAPTALLHAWKPHVGWFLSVQKAHQQVVRIGSVAHASTLHRILPLC